MKNSFVKTDFVMICDDGEIKCHSAIMIAVSNVIAQAYNNDKTLTQFKLTGCSKYDMNLFLDLAYGNESLPDAVFDYSVVHVYPIAWVLQCYDMLDFLHSELAIRILSSQVLDFVKSMYDLNSSITLSLILSKRSIISLSFDKDSFLSYLESDKLPVKNEFDVYNMVLHYLANIEKQFTYQQPSKQVNPSEFYDRIRFATMTYSERRMIRSNKLVRPYLQENIMHKLPFRRNIPRLNIVYNKLVNISTAYYVSSIEGAEAVLTKAKRIKEEYYIPGNNISAKFIPDTPANISKERINVLPVATAIIILNSYNIEDKFIYITNWVLLYPSTEGVFM